MADERRYKDEEVAEIFEAATEAAASNKPALPSADGFTLAELQEIGAQVGLAPERVAQAASAIELRRKVPPAKTYLGMPLSVRRSVDLPRAPTDLEWEILVAELRETFQARGEVSSQGGIRQWANGNLHATIEPTVTGYRLRIETLKGSVMQSTIMGLAGIFMALLLVVALASKDRLGTEFLLPMLFGGLGAGAIATAALRLPGWARERDDQMLHMTERALLLVNGDAESDD